MACATMAENIAFFDPYAEMDDIIAAAKTAGRYGSTLSSGQKRWVSIARPPTNPPTPLALAVQCR